MAFWVFIFEAVAVSLSGVLAPGPVSSVSVGYGSQNPRAGAWVAVGHGLVEFPVMIAVLFGVGAVMDLPWVHAGIALIGGAFLLYLGIGILRTVRQTEISGSTGYRSPLAAGALLSLGNPYFLIWWATVGASLILRSTEFGLVGFAVFAVGHWLCDLGWDTFLSTLSYRGGQFFGKRFQQVIFAISGGFLLFYSGKLLWEGLMMVLGAM
jgi:threonine/homoserine/homoserine lactone efflux protein